MIEVSSFRGFLSINDCKNVTYTMDGSFRSTQSMKSVLYDEVEGELGSVGD